MAQTKQTQRKQPNKQGSPAKFPKKGKPTGKAAKHLQAASDDNSDDNNNTVQNTIRAGRRRRVYGGKAWIYKRPAGLKRKYRPGVGALHEIRHYQREHGTICSKIACARLFREICEKEQTGLRWQASAIMALQEGFEDYLVELFRDTVLAAIHGRRKTVMPKDIHLVRQLRQETDPYAGSVSLRDLKKKNRKGEQDFDEYGNVLY